MECKEIVIMKYVAFWSGKFLVKKVRLLLFCPLVRPKRVIGTPVALAS